ncbi:MAG TPA: Os1348 family NHLP clan protein [Nannocystaceae bacterium]|nr:Os1348 family NHLP clan protein [Nannocystaceae bacterium]
MHRNVELFLGRLATDPALRRRFAAAPSLVLGELGLELTAVEREALAATDPNAVIAFAGALDRRLQRAVSDA